MLVKKKETALMITILQGVLLHHILDLFCSYTTIDVVDEYAYERGFANHEKFLMRYRVML